MKCTSKLEYSCIYLTKDNIKEFLEFIDCDYHYIENEEYLVVYSMDNYVNHPIRTYLMNRWYVDKGSEVAEYSDSQFRKLYQIKY